MYTIEPYTPAEASLWDATVETSRNGTFLLRRGYMDYHSHRFADRSLLVRECARRHCRALRRRRPEHVRRHSR